MRALKKLSQTGDSIIEVLIAIAVVSSVLSFTYLTVNRNLVLMRVNQERTEGSKLVQGQIELLKNVAATAPNTLPASGSFCLFNGVAPVANSGSAPTDDMAADDFSNYPVDNPSGTRGCGRVNTFYHLAIKNVGPKTFKFYARWDRADGKGRDQVIMVYKVE